MFLRRKLTDDEAAALRALDEPHVRVVAVPQRSYPGGNTAPHLIGYTDIDNKGQTGIELSADALLAGRPGLQLVVKSPLAGALAAADPAAARARARRDDRDDHRLATCSSWSSASWPTRSIGTTPTAGRWS